MPRIGPESERVTIDPGEAPAPSWRGAGRYWMSMGSLESDLIAFYDQQAPRREKRRPEDARIAALGDFLGLLDGESRTSVLEVGAGAGHDAAMILGSRRIVALDLSWQNARLCRAKGIAAIVGSGLHLPFVSGAFDALWTMSTLLHVPNDRIGQLMSELARVVQPRSPIAVGVWGGDDREEIFADDELEPKRYYCFRSDRTLQQLCAPHGTVESFRTWTSDTSEQHYQYLILRTPGPP